MITRVRLLNWKTYREFEIHLEAGTTFLVAENGVGKTSFVDAVQWALNPSAERDRALMRRRATQTTVEIDILAGDVPVRVVRTLKLARAGSTTPALDGQAWVNETACDVATALTQLGDAWQADSLFVSRAAFLSDRLLTNPQDPDLEAHLIRIYALDRVQAAIEELRPAIKAAEALAKTASEEERADADQLQLAEDAAVAAVAAVEAAKALAETQRVDASTAAAALQAGQQAVAAAAALERWQSARHGIETDCEQLVGPLPDAISLIDFLQSVETGARRQFIEGTERRALLAGRIADVTESLARLDAAEGNCPVCLRPLDDTSRDHARHAHEDAREELDRQIASVDIDSESVFVDQVRTLRERAERLGPMPPAPPIGDVDLDALNALAEGSRQAAADASAAARLAETQAATAAAQRDTIRAQQRASRQNPYTRLALLESAKRAFEDTITEVLDQQLGPISDEVNRRWDALFHDRPGLRLTAKGHIARTFDDDGDDLPFTSFSSGEKVVAKLLMRLATLKSTTAVPFCWVDEPLEHLDPHARAYVAGTLAHLSSRDDLHQIIVTTYEEQLARQFQAEAPDLVHVEFLRGDHTAV